MASTPLNSLAPTPTDHPAIRPPFCPPLTRELNEAAATIVERLLTQLLGRAYSSRIKLFDIAQICEITGMGKTAIYEMVREGRFPKPLEAFGKNKWRESTLVAWLDQHDPNLRVSRH